MINAVQIIHHRVSSAPGGEASRSQPRPLTRSGGSVSAGIAAGIAGLIQQSTDARKCRPHNTFSAISLSESNGLRNPAPNPQNRGRCIKEAVSLVSQGARKDLQGRSGGIGGYRSLCACVGKCERDLWHFSPCSSEAGQVGVAALLGTAGDRGGATVSTSQAAVPWCVSSDDAQPMRAFGGSPMASQATPAPTPAPTAASPIHKGKGGPWSRVCLNCRKAFLAKHPCTMLCSAQCGQDRRRRLQPPSPPLLCRECGVGVIPVRRGPRRRCDACKARRVMAEHGGRLPETMTNEALAKAWRPGVIARLDLETATGAARTAAPAALMQIDNRGEAAGG